MGWTSGNNGNMRADAFETTCRSQFNFLKNNSYFKNINNVKLMIDGRDGAMEHLSPKNSSHAGFRGAHETTRTASAILVMEIK